MYRRVQMDYTQKYTMITTVSEMESNHKSIKEELNKKLDRKMILLRDVSGAYYKTNDDWNVTSKIKVKPMKETFSDHHKYLS